MAEFRRKLFSGLADVLRGAPGLHARLEQEKFDRQRQTELDEERRRGRTEDVAFREEGRRIDVGEADLSRIEGLFKSQSDLETAKARRGLIEAQTTKLTTPAQPKDKAPSAQDRLLAEDFSEKEQIRLINDIRDRLRQINPSEFQELAEEEIDLFNPKRVGLEDLLNFARRKEFTKEGPLIEERSFFKGGDIRGPRQIDPEILAKGDTATFFQNIPTLDLMERLQGGQRGATIGGTGQVSREEAVAELRRRGEL